MRSLITWKEAWTILRNNILTFSVEKNSYHPNKQEAALLGGPRDQEKGQTFGVFPTHLFQQIKPEQL